MEALREKNACYKIEPIRSFQNQANKDMRINVKMIHSEAGSHPLDKHCPYLYNFCASIFELILQVKFTGATFSGQKNDQN